MTPILRAMADPRYRRVVGVMGSQMGKTDGTLNAVGARLDDDPTPILYVGPSKSFVESQLEPRLTAMLRSAADLWEKTARGKANRRTKKTVAGVDVRLAWAGSPTELASMAAGLALVDERDRMGSDVGGEGDPVTLIEARGSTFAGFCMAVFSTPTRGNVNEVKNPETGLSHWQVAEADDVESPTWKLWQEGTRYEWAWPCPDCGAYFIPRFSLLKWPEGASPSRAEREARLMCPHCGTLIGDAAKTEMNARGVYVAPGQRIEPDGTVIGDEPEGDCASFWVSGLCSPWVSWGRRAKAFLEAVRSGEWGRVQAVVNTGFGELFKVGAGEAHAWERVAERAAGYGRGEVPYGVQRIALTVDVQKAGLYWILRGWGARWESWLIDHGFLAGETEHNEVWNDLAEIVDADYGGLPVRMVLIDSGYRPGERWRRPANAIYDFCRRYPGGRVRATKGHDRQDLPIKTAQAAVNVKGKPTKLAGVILHHLDSDHFKAWVHARLEWPEGEPGGWHLPEDIEEGYCRQIVAETRVVKPSGAATWIRLHRDNHYLDAEAMQVAAATLLQVQTLRPLPPLPERHEDQPAAAPKAAAPVSGRRRARVIASPYV